MDLTNTILGATPVPDANLLLSTIDMQQYMVFIVIGVVVGILLTAMVWGLITMKLAKRKGYRGYFWTGFFFWMIGLIYVVGLPLSDEKRLADMKKLVQISVRAGLR